MMNVIVVLFWGWFLVSLVIVVRRAIRRRKEKRARREGRHAVLQEASGEASDHEPEAVATVPVTDTGAAIGEWVADPRPPMVSAAPPPPTPPAPTRAAPAVPMPVAAPAPEATIAPTPPAPRVATMARTAASPVTVAQVIAGIAMPCGLVPLTLSDHDLRYDIGQRAQFFTTEFPAAVVSTKLCEELARIGLTVTPHGERTVLAQRGQLAVEMRIVTVGALIDGVASVDYRSAPPDSVVVEFNVVSAA